MAFNEIKAAGNIIKSADWNDFVAFAELISGVSYDIYHSGSKYSLDYNWFQESSQKLSETVGDFTQVFNWYNDSYTTLEGVMESGQEYTSTYNWFVDSAQTLSAKLLDILNSGGKYTSDYLSGSKYTNAYSWYSESASKLSLGTSNYNWVAPTAVSGIQFAGIGMLSGALSIGIVNYIASTNALLNFAGSSNYSTHKITYADTTSTGHLTSSDWNKFNEISISGIKYTSTYNWFLESANKISTISGSLSDRIDLLGGAFDSELYATSANIIANYAKSTNIYNISWIDTFSGNIDSRIDAIESDTFDHTLYIVSSVAITRFASSANAFISSMSEINMLSDVDTASTSPARDEVLKWNGTKWVPAPYDYSFLFTFDTFSWSDTLDPQLMGSGSGIPISWHPIGSLTFTASYTNGPPSSVAVWVRSDDTYSWISGWTNNKFNMLDSPTSKAITESIYYPNDVNKTLTFYMSANTSTPKTVDITFRNLLYYGKSNAGSLVDSNLYSLAVSSLTTTANDRYNTFASVSPGVGEYVILAYPDSYGTMAEAGRFGYKRTADNTHMTALFNLQDLNPHTNAGGFKENYNIYKSEIANLGTGTLKTTSTTVINQIKYGYNASSSGFTKEFITNLTGADVSNDEDQAATYSVSPTASDYVFVAVPTRFNVTDIETGDKAFRYKRTGGLEATLSGSKVSSSAYWQNPCGYTENYNIFKSKVVGLPAGTVGFGMARLNLIHYGLTTTATGWTSSEITGLQASSSTTDNTQSWGTQLTPSAGEYVLFACPARLTDLAVGTDYESDGNVGTAFTFDGLTAAFQPIETVEVTNIYGFKENYDVYRSTITDIGDGIGTLVTLDARAITDYQYWGVDVDTSAAGWALADFETMCATGGGSKSTSTDITGAPQFTVTAGAGQYIWFCYPKRLGTVTFWVGGFEGGFQPVETVSLTNMNGWTEDYYCWRSTNANLGSTAVTTT
jgi:hypothetical protein